MATANDLLLHLRCHVPHLARRLDPIRGLGAGGGVLTVRVAGDGWCTGELRRLRPELEGAAARVFGEPMQLEIETGPDAPDALPLPLASTKYWNHAVFVAVTAGRACAVAVPKPTYLGRWLPLKRDGDLPPLAELQQEEKVGVFRYPVEGSEEGSLLAALPDIVDDLAELARDHRSYAQMLLGFPGDTVADRLEARLYGIKEWGTPRTPGPILHKHVGRLHYLPPDVTPLGLRLAEGA